MQWSKVLDQVPCQLFRVLNSASYNCGPCLKGIESAAEFGKANGKVDAAKMVTQFDALLEDFEGREVVFLFHLVMAAIMPNPFEGRECKICELGGIISPEISIYQNNFGLF
jgi:hypothetical protein